MGEKVVNNNFAFILLMILYRLGLDYVYIETISPLFSYANFTYEPTVSSQIMSILAFCLGTVAVIPYRKDSSSFVSQSMMLLYLMTYVPMTSFWWCKGQTMDFMLANIIFWMLLFGITRLINGINLRKYIYPNERMIIFIMILMVFVILYISGTYANFRIHLSLDNVYDLRHEARNYNMPLIFRYIWNASDNVIPLFIIYFLGRRYKLLPWFLVFVVLLNFSIAGMKSALFKMIICVILYYWGKRDIAKYLPACFFGLITLTIIEFLINEYSLLSIMFVRRGLFMPSLLDELFFDYVNNHGFLFYNPQQTELTFAIGETYFNNEGMRCNNGWFTDAYINLGWIGIFIYPLFYAFLFQTCEKSFVGNNKNSIFFASFIIVMTLRSSLVTTSLLTHGLFILIMSMVFMSNTAIRNKNIINTK